MITDDSLILIGAAILLQLGLWWRVHLALMRIEARLDDQNPVGWMIEEWEEQRENSAPVQNG